MAESKDFDLRNALPSEVPFTGRVAGQVSRYEHDFIQDWGVPPGNRAEQHRATVSGQLEAMAADVAHHGG